MYKYFVQLNSGLLGTKHPDNLLMHNFLVMPFQHTDQNSRGNLHPRFSNSPVKNVFHFNEHPYTISSRKVEPQSPLISSNLLYELLKPLWLELRLLGVLPVEKITTEYGVPVFNRTFAAMFYSVVFYVVVGVYVAYVGKIKLWELKALKSSQFDDAVNAYLFLVYLLPHVVIPLGHWRQAGQIAHFLNEWTTFQNRFHKLTGDNLQTKEWRRVIIIFTILVPLLSSIAIVADWLMMPEFKMWEIYCYTYTTVLVHLHITLWYVMCCSVASSARHLIRILQQDVQKRRQVNVYNSLWQDLNCLSRKMGESFCYIYGCIIVIWFTTLTLSLYGGLTGILDHGISVREMALLSNAALCTFMLFMISDAGQRVSEEMGPNFYASLQVLHFGLNKETRQQLNFFRYDVTMNPPVINLGGYVTINRNLLLSLLVTVVSQMVILLQFRIGVELVSHNNNATYITNVFNQSCNLTCKQEI